jgi:hypothetical protein
MRVILVRANWLGIILLRVVMLGVVQKMPFCKVPLVRMSWCPARPKFCV